MSHFRPTLAATGRTAHAAPKMDRPAAYNHRIARLRKNAMERLDIALTEYNGSHLTNISVIRDSVGFHALNSMRGTARYVSIQTRQLPALIAALQDAEVKARELGLIENRSSQVVAS